MAELVLGPLLRHVGEDEATVWVETDAACEVEVLGARERTFAVAGHHYALVHCAGLEPASTIPYAVRLDGEQVQCVLEGARQGRAVDGCPEDDGLGGGHGGHEGGGVIGQLVRGRAIREAEP